MRAPSIARRAACCLAALLFAPIPAPAPAQGALAGMTSDAEQALWPMIGRVNLRGVGSRAMCTGTLIAPDLVLTAAHCLRGPGGRGLPAPEDVIFVAGWRRGEWIADRAAARLELHPAARPGAPLSGEVMEADLALLHLAAPMPPEVPPLPLAALPDPAPVLSILGYRADRPHALSRHATCRVEGVRGTVFGTDCPVIPGSSGAPVVMETPEGWRVVGVVSAAVGSGAIRSLAVAVAPWPGVAGGSGVSR